MGKKKKSKKHTNNNVGISSKEQYEEYLQELYGMEFIAGFTENGVPFGIFEEDTEIADIPSDSDDEMPFYSIGEIINEV